MTADAFRILVVEDDVLIREVLVAALAEGGYHVAAAMHGAHALEVLADTAVDLVIADVMMPHLGGIELCKHVKATSHAAVILMSSAPPATALTAGADAFVAKPFDLNAVERVVATVLADVTLADDMPSADDA